MRQGPGDAGYRPELDSVLRRIRAEAIRADRMHLHDELTSRLTAADQYKAMTAEGRRRFGLHVALDIVGQSERYTDGPWDTEVGAVLSEVDSLEVGLRLEQDPDGPDPWPVRVRVVDGGDSTIGTAYLTPDEADQAAEALSIAARRAREDRASWVNVTLEARDDDSVG